MTLMSRQPWNPETATEVQLRLRTEVGDLAAKRRAVETDLYEKVRAAHEAGVPMEDLAEQADESRATLFRRVKALRTGYDEGAGLD